MAAALALAQQGVQVKVLEQAQELGEIGAGVQLGPNAFSAFDALGIGGLRVERRHLDFGHAKQDALGGARALDAAGLGFPVRMHDLRHAHASWLLAGGADLKTVMERLGHSQIQTTQKYLHTLPDTHDQALQALTRTEQRSTQ